MTTALLCMVLGMHAQIHSLSMAKPVATAPDSIVLTICPPKAVLSSTGWLLISACLYRQTALKSPFLRRKVAG